MTAPLLDQSGPADESPEAGTPVPERDTERVAALHAFGVLHQPRQPDLDAAARLAAYVCGMPTAVVNLIDADRQWPVGAHGCEPVDVDRAWSMCAHTVTGSEVVHVADASADARFARSPFVVGPVGAVRGYASAPLLTRDGFAIGTVCAFDERVRELSEEQLGLLRDVAEQVMARFELRRTAVALARATTRDPLTGLANQRALDQAVAAAIARAERGLGTPSVVVLDLDRFGEVNDAAGPVAGDSLLRMVAERLTGTTRAVDTVARAGDEFVVLLEHTGGSGAQAAVGRLRAALAGLAAAGGTVPVTASLGVATYRPGDTPASLMSRADAEMYAEKARRG